VANGKDESFDIILIDSTDPVGPAVGLFTAEFYQQVHRLLTPNGIMVAQSESPRFNVETFKTIYKEYKKVFGKDKVHAYLAFIPTYPTGMWSFSFCSKGDLHPVKDIRLQESRQFAADMKLNYYNEEIHRAAFVLPRFVKAMID
jgi:spermidine synthase